MGYEKPEAIIVTGRYKADNGQHWADFAFSTAQEIYGRHGCGQLVGEVIDAVVNDARSFLVAWDGSKEGWLEDERGDAARAEFVQWLRDQRYPDGSGPLWWAAIQYGGDDKKVVVLAHSNEPKEGRDD